MKAKIKYISYYIIQFLLFILIFIFSLLFLLKNTLLSESYILNALDKNNYYSNLDNSIKDNMGNYIMQSGLSEDVLDDIYSKAMVKKDVKKIINGLYNNQTINIDTTDIKEELTNNINKALEKNNVEILDDDALDEFSEQIIDVYTKEIIITDSLKSYTNIIPKINKILNIVLILIFWIIFALYFVTRKIFKKRKNILAIPFISTTLLVLVTHIWLNNSIDFNNLYFLDSNISSVIKYVYNNMFFRWQIVLIIISILLIIKTIFTTKKHHHKSKNKNKDFKN